MNTIMKKGFIFDIDGTLYSQKAMRMKMLKRLLFFYAVRPNRLKELFALKSFRELREMDEWKQARFKDLYREISKKTTLPVTKIERTIQYWMFQAPLDIINKCSYQDVVSYVNEQHRNGKKVIIYSDYPAIEKLNVIGIEYDLVFAFGVDGINEQKPSLQIMEKIVSESGLTADQLLYVGDRDDRDKASAELVNISYCDIQTFKQMIIQQENNK